MPEVDGAYADESPTELIVRRVEDPQDDGCDSQAEAPGQAPGPEHRTRSGSMMDQGQM